MPRQPSGGCATDSMLGHTATTAAIETPPHPLRIDYALELHAPGQDLMANPQTTRVPYLPTMSDTFIHGGVFMVGAASPLGDHSPFACGPTARAWRA